MIQNKMIAKKCHELQKILGKQGVSQEAIAQKLGTTQATVSNTFKGTTKKFERLPEIIHFLIEAGREILSQDETGLSGEQEAKCEEVIKELESYPLFKKYREKDRLGNARLPLSGQNKNYLLRTSDLELLHYTAHPPTAVLVVGGFKMGKTSTLHRIVEEIGDNKTTIWIDFSDPHYENYHKEDRIDAYYRAFSQDVESQLPVQKSRFRINLQGSANFTSWLRDDIVANTKSNIIFVLENSTRLNLGIFSDFLDALHSVANRFFRNRQFRDIVLLFSANSIEEDDKITSVYESRFFQKCRVVNLIPFSHRHLVDLVSVIFEGSETGHHWLCERALERFGGHPYLTHVYLENLRAKCQMENGRVVLPSEKEFEMEERNAFDEGKALFVDDILKRLCKRISPESRKAFVDAYDTAGRGKNGGVGSILNFKSSVQQWEDSGLFRTPTGSSRDYLEPLCSWMVELIFGELNN